MIAVHCMIQAIAWISGTEWVNEKYTLNEAPKLWHKGFDHSRTKGSRARRDGLAGVTCRSQKG